MRLKRSFFFVIFSLITLFSSVNAFAAQQSFQSWLANFKIEAVASGINPQFFDEVFKGMTIGHRQIHFDKTQPEHRITYTEYQSKRISKHRIYLGKQALKKYGPVLKNIGKEYGVDYCVVTAIWGMETAYGNYMGGFDVIRSLATLAYEGRRAEFFRNELIIALHILQEGHVSRQYFKGEWAGGSGHSQFLPSSWKQYAVDYTGDGHKDIWTTKEDAFASMANYLHTNGWKYGEPIRAHVILPHGFNENLVGYKVKKSVREWETLGVRAAPGWRLPTHNITASIIQPYGGPTLMIFNNWRIIMTYNRSTFYAGAISKLADEVCGR